MGLRLCDGDSLGTQEVERPPWEAGTRGIEGQQIKRAQYIVIVNYRLWESETGFGIAIAL
jgi:hypothetical protein